MSTARRLVLVGGGHAHLEVLRAAARQRFDAELVLLSPSPVQVYSGMMPGQLRAAWPESALSVDLPSLCRAAGARFVEAAATHVHASVDGVTVRSAAGDVTGSHGSLDIGASASGVELPGVRTHACRPKPLSSWHALLARTDMLAGETSTSVSCVVVGGGAAGTELALALSARLRVPGRTARITIVSAAASVPSGFDTSMASRIARALAPLFAARDIHVVTNATVRAVHAHGIELGDGRQVDADLVIWATGAAAPALVRESGLPTDDAGYFTVDRTLRATTGVPLWGAGDCVSVVDAPWMTKSGVYAVRAAPILAHNLRAATSAESRAMNATRRFDPQRHTMFILDTADGRALLTWRGVVLHAAWTLRLKRFIDERFVARYQR